MSKFLEKVFHKAAPGEKPKPRNWLRSVGILSGVLWVGAMGAGAAFMFKDKIFKPKPDAHAEGNTKGTHAEGHEAAAEDPEYKMLDIPAAAEEGHAEAGHEAAGPEAHASGHGNAGESGHEGGHAGTHEGGDAHAADAPEEAQAAVGHEGGEAPAHEADAQEKHGGEAEEAPAHESSGPAIDADGIAALKELAQIYAGQGNLEKAVVPLQKILRAPSRDPAVLSLAADVFLGTARYQEALSAARQALTLPGVDKAHLHVTAVLAEYRLGRSDDAMKEAREAVAASPKDVDMLTALGTMEIEMGPEGEECGKSLAEALKIRPDFVPALYQQGRKAQLDGNFKDAETIFRKVLKKEPRHAKAHGQLGAALYALRKQGEARKEFNAALALSPKDYNTWFNLGELNLAEAGQEKSLTRIRDLRAQAMACFLKAVEWNPEHAEAHYRIGVLLNGNGQFKEAIRHLEASWQVDSQHVPTLVQLAVAYESLKQLDRAKAYLEKALKIDPLDKIVIFKLKRIS